MNIFPEEECDKDVWAYISFASNGQLSGRNSNNSHGFIINSAEGESIVTGHKAGLEGSVIARLIKCVFAVKTSHQPYYTWFLITR